MTKPLRMGELVARTTALLRRAYPQAMSDNLVFGPYRFDPEKRSLWLRDQPVELKNREYELALFMFRNAGRLLSRAHLREVVWGETSEAPSRSLDTHMSRLRTKLELTPPTVTWWAPSTAWATAWTPWTPTPHRPQVRTDRQPMARPAPRASRQAPPPWPRTDGPATATPEWAPAWAPPKSPPGRRAPQALKH